VTPTARAAADRLLTTAAQASSTVVVLLDGIASAPVAGLRAVRVAGGRIVPAADAARSATVRQADGAGLLDGAPAVSALPELLGDLAHDRPEVTR
jgi:chemotaxis response regulator CheB